MSRIQPERRKHSSLPAQVLGVGVGLAVLVTGAFVLDEIGPGNIGKGFAVGGLIAVGAFALAMWRSSRRPDSTTTADRALLGAGDERDRAIVRHAPAVVGLLAMPLSAAAAVALALGADVAMVMAILLWSELGVGIVAFVVLDRRS